MVNGKLAIENQSLIIPPNNSDIISLLVCLHFHHAPITSSSDHIINKQADLNKQGNRYDGSAPAKRAPQPSAQSQPNTKQSPVSGKHSSFLKARWSEMSLILCSLQTAFNVTFSLQEQSLLVFLVTHLC